MTDPMVAPGCDPADPRIIEERRRRRIRRRLGIWGALLVVGAALGTVYATGFADTGGATGTTSAPGANTNDPEANEDNSALASLITQPSNDLTWNWGGRWGSVSSAALYQLDLDALASGNDYFSGVYLTNTPSGFSDLQLQFRIADIGTGNSCNAGGSDLTGATSANQRVMVFDNDDAQVTFSGMGGVTTGLPGGSTYCIGGTNYANSGKDTAGTFIRKVTTGGSFSGTYPTFVATLNEMP